MTWNSLFGKQYLIFTSKLSKGKSPWVFESPFAFPKLVSEERYLTLLATINMKR